LSKLVIYIDDISDTDFVETSSPERVQAEPDVVAGFALDDPGRPLPVPAPNRAARTVNPLILHSTESTMPTDPLQGLPVGSVIRGGGRSEPYVAQPVRTCFLVLIPRLCNRLDNRHIRAVLM